MTEVNASQAQYSCTISGTTFRVLRFHASEAMSELFHYDLVLRSDNPEIDTSSMIRQTAEITVSWGDSEKSYAGLVARFSQIAAGRTGETDAEWGEYAVAVVPFLWLLGQRSDCRIFQEKSADQILREVLDGGGMAGRYRLSLDRTYPAREYCVQYRETDLDFISRLMEEEGIFYWFDQGDGGKMVIGDGTSAYGTCSPDDTVRYHSPTGVLATADEHLSTLTLEDRVHTGKIVLKDYDYRDPRQPLKVDRTAENFTDLEVYDYHPERYHDDGRGRVLAVDAVEARTTLARTLSATGSWRSPSAGCKLTLTHAYRSDLNREWLVVSVAHDASEDGSGSSEAGCTLVAIPSDVVFRPAPITPQPAMHPQTATVVGPPGEDIYMDDLGRAKVHFHWDRLNQEDDSASCWIRVATLYAGTDEDSQKKHGIQFHPLVGDEVVVDFLEGDPDTPLIVGSVYNRDQKPIVKPDQLIRNQILTRYQHKLLLDDKNTSITLSTGGNEILNMKDKERGKGVVKLATTGNESLTLEDDSESHGNTARLATDDGHELVMAEKSPERGIAMRTKDGHRLELDDENRKIEVQSKDNHRLLLDDDNTRVVLNSREGRRLALDDDSDRIEIVSSDGHSILVDDRDKKISVASFDDAVKLVLDLNSGKVTLSTDSGEMEIKAGQDLKIQGNNVTIQASGDLKLKGWNVEAEGVQEATLKGRQAKVEGTNTAEVTSLTETKVESRISTKVTGTMTELSSTGTTTIRGMLVRIN